MDSHPDFNREVTERDLRQPQFRDVKPDELEFRRDGVLVRKDRWEQGFRRVASLLSRYDKAIDKNGFEIDEIVNHLDKILDQLVYKPSPLDMLAVLSHPGGSVREAEFKKFLNKEQIKYAGLPQKSPLFTDRPELHGAFAEYLMTLYFGSQSAKNELRDVALKNGVTSYDLQRKRVQVAMRAELLARKVIVQEQKPSA